TVIRDATLARIFGFYVTPDTGSYLLGLAIRSRPYPILAWLTDAPQHPWLLVALQIGLAALATMALVYVVARKNPWLAALVGVLYVLFTRSWRKSAWVAGGMAALLVATCTLTWYAFGRFRISAGTGYYLAFPLFAYHLFNSNNGPASARIDHTLRTCDPGVDY